MYYIIWRKASGQDDRSFVGHVECGSSDEALHIWVEKIRGMTTEDICSELGIYAMSVDSDAENSST